MRSAEQPPDLFDLLVASAAGAPPGEMADQVATMITAGHETTATTLFWALYLLSQTPGLQMAVAAEAQATPIRPETAADCLPKLRLAEAVVQETLRLYPPCFHDRQKGCARHPDCRRARAEGLHGLCAYMDAALCNRARW